MWSVGLCVVAVLTICIIHWIYKWRNPKCNGVLPPGSMGLPLIGETLQLIIPSYSMELPPFLRERLNRYGPIFRTNVAGRSVIVSADPEFNYFLLQQEGKLVESWAFDTFAKIFEQGESRPNGAQVKKYVRNLVLNHFGVDTLKEKLLPQLNGMVCKTLGAWSNQDSIEAKSEAAKMSIDFCAKQLFSYDPEESPVKLSDLFRNFVEGLLSFPVNIPGTAHHRCLMDHKKVLDMVRDALSKRLLSTESDQRDLLNRVIQDMSTEKFLTEDFIIQLMFGLLFVNSDSISMTIALALKLLLEHPLVLEELTAEHETVLKNKDNSNSPITWEEYKSMTFTLKVINETLRLANVALGMFRKALKDIKVKGYTIPEGWVVVLATSALHLDSDKFENPLEFNPRRWKDLESSVLAKNFMPFGSGMKQCAGSEYSKVFIATFLHVLVTKYRWTKINGCEVMRSPMMRFPNGFHFKVSEKNN
ncbi:beta-amyrin 16-alpha-hydroxylase CYP87D16-like [Cornus florida]|uniref:beta-amyrin 16-alpha-hydroxylase CYP87D16-like n=1 Tax=Cornus florida TaxID=4283 RepID=UPI00289D828B|nr:beta-amyrin 16-alpha-hydroxylase CYP87D16-like [Cornus florida]